MKQLGIVRRLDHLGRVCLPKELRRSMKISEGDSVEFYADGDRIVIKKYDLAGDLEQILDNAERGIRQQDKLLPETTSALLAKMEELKAILARSGQK